MINVTPDKFVSAADLVKRSAMQTCYYRRHGKEAPVTPNMIEGDIQAERKSVSNLIEMRGTFQHKETTICFCIDEICVPNEFTVMFVEHKMLTDELEQWYLRSCIIQTAFYQALANYSSNKHYNTATFKVNQGYTRQYLNITGKQITSMLQFSNDTMIFVESLNHQKIVEFYLKKLHATYEYETAKLFDIRFKFKEWDYLKQFIETK